MKHRSNTIKLGRGISYRFHRGTYRLRAYDRSRVPREKTISLNTDSPALAALRAKDYYDRFVTGRWDPWEGAVANVSLGEALDRFRAARKDLRPKTLLDYSKIVGALRDRVGADRGLDAVRPEDIRFFTQNPSLTDSSRLSYYRRLSAFFGWCLKQNIMATSVMRRVDPPKPPETLPNGLLNQELANVLEVAARRPWARDAFALIAWTGLRPSEAARLRWDDVDEDVIRVVGMTKTNTERAVSIIPQARQVLDGLPRRGERVLAGAKGGKISVGYLSKVFAGYRDVAGLPKRYNLYSLRHTYAAEYRRRGGALHGLQHEMGHKSIQTTEKYGHLGPDERRKYTLGVFTDPTVREPIPPRFGNSSEAARTHKVPTTA